MTFNFDLGIDDQASFVEETRGFTIGDLLTKRARTDPDAVAVCGSERSLTYEELDRRVDFLAGALCEQGVEPGESTVAILSENRPAFVEILYASARLGCLIGAQNWRLEADELVHCIDTVDPDVLFVSGRQFEKVAWIEDRCEATPTYVVLDDVDDAAVPTISYRSFIEAGQAAVDTGGQRSGEHPDQGVPAVADDAVDPEQGFVVMYTSGTTGLPKGVVVSHRAEFARTNQVLFDYELQQGDSFPSWAPMFHMGGIDWVVTTAVLGGTYYTIDGFDADRIIEVLQTAESPISWLLLFPGMTGRFLDALEATSTDSDSYQDIRSVGALLDLMNPETLARVTEILDAPAQNTYGSTEVGHATSGNKVPPGVEPAADRLQKAESPYIQLKVVDTDRNPVERGESGELAVRGPTLCSGYLNQPDANREEFERGWFYTGDILRWNHDGTYSYVNRRKYLIKSGGENIYPAEIEEVLVKHDLVESACVVRVPDEKWGEVPRAVVSSAQPERLSPDELIELVGDHLANYKLPHYIEIVDPEEFPRSTTGKIVRTTVEEWPLADATRVRRV